MELILLEKIQNLGDLGDIVKVKSGYGRNYLIPQGKAVPASEEAKEQVEERRRELAKLDSERRESAEAKAALLPERLTVKRLVAEEGKLFGSVSPVDVAELLQAAEIAVQRSEISMPDGPIKTLGEHTVSIILHPEVQSSIEVVVEAENEPEEPGTPAADKNEQEPPAETPAE
ncbi:MAG TPA: 50S ribosomal protein L9 [Gammaproteobacteria bacterium]|jgi:large subunit ribosomal protein L9|nr:50S ribosomal protein L9 [Acidiferrobacteraceae bacterium]MDP6552382.1 50S ribosomal protein L9 [Arenicellales bacterium]MDP6790331.1 50S ribosomal protein L9 [Arenicellales bacterium]MDP6918195.1 50S ribosomal protein L9 [Arenicellales bacterium]HCX87461.1 50S ribosomal protein L9 [Gammaproteobacteria bacterium]|tara:strand:+ start:876 stop:1394 length:519 start_codon:yes stop_codon:yes gene_type:complete